MNENPIAVVEKNDPRVEKNDPRYQIMMRYACFTRERSNLYWNKMYVSSFVPKLIAKRESRNLATGEVTYSYEVTIEGCDNPIWFKNLNKINWFDDFMTPDFDLTPKRKQLLQLKLKLEAELIDSDDIEVITNDCGLYFVENKPVLVLGDVIISDINDKRIHFSTSEKLTVKRYIPSGKDMYGEINRMLGFMEEIYVGPILFYGTLFGAVKPIIAGVCENTKSDFILALIAQSGHLKTTLARLYTNFSQYESDLEMSFSDSKRNDFLKKEMQMLGGFTYTLDDYHAAQSPSERNKFRVRLDNITREVSGAHNACSVIITAESLHDEAIFSCMDRIVQIKIPHLTDNELLQYKSKVSMLNPTAMVGIAVQFLTAVIKDYDNLEETIQEFDEQFKAPEWITGSTRVGNQNRMLNLVEFMFRKYVCNGDMEISHYEAFQTALENQEKAQIKELEILQRKGSPIFYLEEIKGILDEYDQGVCKDIVIVEKEYEYDPENEGQALLTYSRDVLGQKHRPILQITSKALDVALYNRLQQPINMKQVTDQMHHSNVLYEDSDSRTKKINNKRHYVIDVNTLQMVCERKSNQE